jgi:basic membrane protein A
MSALPMPATRWRRVLAGLAVAVALLLLAQWRPGVARPVPGAAPPTRVALFVNGTLGDQSFYDAAARGLRQAHDTLGIDTRAVEGGGDPTRWESAFVDLVDGGDFDVIVTGTFTMTPLVQKLAPLYPRVRFIVFDAAVDRAQCRCDNVYSVLFRQNEGAYLAGWLATRLGATAGGAAPTVGVVGGMQIPVIDDFIVGFTAGAQAADPRTRVLRQYVNSFTDPATGKEIAKALFAEGAGTVFQAAGGSGQGVIEAAAEAGRWAIGVDADQYLMYSRSNPQRAAAIATSVLKQVDVAILRALTLDSRHALPYGQTESLGLESRGIGLARSAPVLAQASPALLAELDRVEQSIVSGRVRVPSAFNSSASAP